MTSMAFSDGSMRTRHIHYPRFDAAASMYARSNVAKDLASVTSDFPRSTLRCLADTNEHTELIGSMRR